jgi:hypothetical protein
MRRRARPQFHEPSLVPMADMLTNTVGVVLFILIFTVLTAGGAVLMKRLPMERTTDLKPIQFVCISGRIVPLPGQALADEFFKPIEAYYRNGQIGEFVSRFKQRRVENEYFVLTGQQDGALFLVYQPKPGLGDTAADISLPTSKFASILARADPDEKFIHFILYPDGVTAFRAARDYANNRKFGTGWMLLGVNEPLRSCVSCEGGGSTFTVQ